MEFYIYDSNRLLKFGMALVMFLLTNNFRNNSLSILEIPNLLERFLEIPRITLFVPSKINESYIGHS